MADDTNVQSDYKEGLSPDASANAGRQAAQGGQNCAPKQSNESDEAYEQRVNAFNQEKNRGDKQ